MPLQALNKQFLATEDNAISQDRMKVDITGLLKFT